jgi:hypothetical protein
MFDNPALIASAELKVVKVRITPPAPAGRDSRVRRFGLRLLSLPQSRQARAVVGAGSEIGKRLENALEYSGRVETTVLLEEPEVLDAETI